MTNFGDLATWSASYGNDSWHNKVTLITTTLTILENKNTEYSISNLAEKNGVKTVLLGFKQEGYGTAAMSQKLIRIIILVPESARLR